MVRMPRQADVIKLDTSPRSGHEQKGYRPYIVLSNNIVAETSNVVTVAPISTTDRTYPLYVSINSETMQTHGKVLLDQITTIDYEARKVSFVEVADDQLMDELLEKVVVIFQKNS